MTRTAYIFSVGSAHTTARYFERAIAKREDWRCVYIDALFDPALPGPEDVLLFVDPAPAWPLGLELCPCTTIAYLIDVHQGLHARLHLSRFFDAVFIAQKDLVSCFKAAGHPHTHWLPLACDPETHDPGPTDRIYDVGFVGKLGARGSRRYEILSTTLPKYRTNEYRRYHDPREMAVAYSKSKVVLNASINGDVNMRVFEAMAAGALLISDRVCNGFAELFTEGVHYVGYSNVQELQQQVEYFLEHSADRERIAGNGREVVLNGHTYEQRWEFMLRHAKDTFGHAPARKLGPAALAELYSEVFTVLRQPWRIWQTSRRYGINFSVAVRWITAWGRWLNARVPLTPNAIRARWNAT